MDTILQDPDLRDPDDPVAISDIEMLEKELPVENLAPDELPLENALMEEVAKHRHQLYHGGLSNKGQVDPGYGLLPAPVSNIKKFMEKKRSIKGALG